MSEHSTQGSPPLPLNYETAPSETDTALDVILKSGRGARWTRAAINFMATAITSAVGGTSSFLMGIASASIGAATGLWSDANQDSMNKIFAACNKEAVETIAELRDTIGKIINSVNASEDQFADRVEDPRYQGLIRKAFAGWSRGESEEKREMIRRLLSHAAEMPDPDYNLFNLFFDWVRRYNELHFRLIRSLKKQGKTTRLKIWQGMGGKIVRDDSPEAEVFDCLMLDLTFGHVLRIARQYDPRNGRKLRHEPKTRGQHNPYMKSALDNDERYELTLVGEKFIHQVMDELISKLEPK